MAREIFVNRDRLKPTSAEIATLAGLRTGYEELSHAFEALRRLIERGYSRMGHNIEFAQPIR
jgi:hypothetical protein